MTVGELDVAIAGQKATVQFLSDQVVLQFETLRSVYTLMNLVIPGPESFGKLLGFSGLGLSIQFGSRNPIELFPNPKLIVRLLSPTVRKMTRAANV